MMTMQEESMFFLMGIYNTTTNSGAVQKAIQSTTDIHVDITRVCYRRLSGTLNGQYRAEPSLII